MAGRYLSGTYKYGYVLNGAYSSITLGVFGSVSGYGIVGGTRSSYSMLNLGISDAHVAAAPGIELRAGGEIDNGSPSHPAAKIFGGTFLSLNGPSLGGPGIAVSNGGVINNFGAIKGGEGFPGQVPAEGADPGGAGIAMTGGGIINNSGSIVGGENASNTVGTPGVVLFDGGTISNAGTIAGGNGGHLGYGVALLGGGTIINTGSIVGGVAYKGGARGSGIAIFATGTVTNGAGGYINSVQTIGIGPPGATVTNYGTIGGVSLGTNGVLVAEGGSKLVGAASGGGGAVLELGSAGSTGKLYGLGATITNFATLAFDSGASWTVEGGTAGFPGTISGFTVGDTIFLDGFLANSKSYTGSGLVLNDSAGNSVTLGITGSFTSADFSITAQSGLMRTIITDPPATGGSAPVGFDFSDIGLPGSGTSAAEEPALPSAGGFATPGTANGDIGGILTVSAGQPAAIGVISAGSS